MYRTLNLSFYYIFLQLYVIIKCYDEMFKKKKKNIKNNNDEEN